MRIGKFIAAIIVSVLIPAATACSYVSVNEDRDNAQVVAEVNGTQILKSDYKEQADNILSSVNMTLESIELEKNPEIYKQYVLDVLTQQELVLQEALKEGIIDLSEEHIKEVEKEKSDEADLYYSLFVQRAEEEGAADVKAEALKNWNEYLRQNGLDDLNAAAIKSIRSQAMSEIYESQVGDIVIPEEDVKKYYDEQVALQEDAVKENPENYNTYKSMDEAYVNPENSRYVKNLLIKFPDDISTKISELRQEGDNEAADKLRDEALKDIQAKAEEALNRVKGGEDFDAVIADIGEDPGMETEPNKTFGYLVVDGGTDYATEFQDAAMALKSAGEISPLVATDFGYHILMYQKDGAGPVDFEILKEDITNQLKSEKENEILGQYIEDLKSGAQIKTYVNRV